MSLAEEIKRVLTENPDILVEVLTSKGTRVSGVTVVPPT